MRKNLSNSLGGFKIWRRKLGPWAKWAKLAIILITVGVLGVFAWAGLTKIWEVAGSWLGRPFNTISILADPTKALDSIDGRTNILIMGKGGEGHEGADLTDTMIVVSIRLRDRKVSMISVPRDIWIDSMRAKINSAYYYGQKKNPDGGGVTLAKDAIYQVTGLPIQYAAVVNFEGFEKAIDSVGGVEIMVERSFVDEKYPRYEFASEQVNGEEVYEMVKFEKGLQHMDGKTALIFSRSRYSTDPAEGTDFARSQRQQKVLLALILKIKSKETALNLNRIKELRNIFDQYTETNLDNEEILALGRVGMNVQLSGIEQIRIDEGTAEEPGVLISPPIYKYGQWVLVPRSGEWASVQNYIKNLLEK